MALLVGKAYDPTGGAIISKATSALLAITALDTTNLRLVPTIPSNGIVVVRQQFCNKGGSEVPQLMSAILEGSTVRGRRAPITSGRPSGSANSLKAFESIATIPGLTPAATPNWDAAYGVETVLASSNIVYGGPQNATANDSGGSYIFEVWEALNCLGAVEYDPSTIANFSTATATAHAALSTSFLRLTFTTAASGPGSTQVLVRFRGGCLGAGGTAIPGVTIGVMDGSTLKGRVAPLVGGSINGALLATTQRVMSGGFLVTGLTANTAYTWDLSMSVEFVVASSNLSVGGPNNTTADDNYGGLEFSVWKA